MPNDDVSSISFRSDSKEQLDRGAIVEPAIQRAVNALEGFEDGVYRTRDECCSCLKDFTSLAGGRTIQTMRTVVRIFSDYQSLPTILSDTHDTSSSCPGSQLALLVWYSALSSRATKALDNLSTNTFSPALLRRVMGFFLAIKVAHRSRGFRKFIATPNRKAVRTFVLRVSLCHQWGGDRTHTTMRVAGAQTWIFLYGIVMVMGYSQNKRHTMHVLAYTYV